MRCAAAFYVGTFDPYGFIGRFQGFSGQGKIASGIARELFDSYRKNKQTQKRMAEVLVTLFEECVSFAGAKSRIGFLEELNAWDSAFTPRILAALEANGQINGSWGVRERVHALAKKHSSAPTGE